DLRVLAAVADEMDVHLGLPDAAASRRELAALGACAGERVPDPLTGPAPAAEPEPGEALLATWKQLLGLGRMEDGEPYLVENARQGLVRLAAATLAGIGLADGGRREVTGPAGSVSVTAVVAAGVPDGVVWLTAAARDCDVRRDLG